MLKRSLVIALPATCILVLATLSTMPVHGASSTPAPKWNRAAAANFLDQRETWWQQWPRAQKDHGTVCISCHTQLPYAMARPTLRHDLSETTLSAPEKAMLDSVEKRVTNWSQMEPFYSDAKNGAGKTVEAHNTEAVLNAIILSSFDSRLGHLRSITIAAFNNAWALQEQTGDLAGSWVWQNFHLGPWEGDESGYQHTALLLFAAHEAPDHYAQQQAVRPHLDAMSVYLRAQYAEQPLLNQLYVLQAAAHEPSLLTPDQRDALLTALQRCQQPDGGWNTSALDPRKRVDDSPTPTASDGYATAIAVLALETSDRGSRSPMLKRGIAWLASHQHPDGSWLAESINKHRGPQTDPALFMTDAATAYAALALDSNR